MYVWSGRAQYQIWFMTNYFKGAFEKNVYFIKFKIIAVFELRTKPDMIWVSKALWIILIALMSKTKTNNFSL